MTRNRILVFGYINVNVIDGSAFFLSGVSEMLACDPTNDIILVTANPLKRTLVVDNLIEIPNVHIIDPYNDRNLEPSAYPWLSGQSMSHHDAGLLLAHYVDKFSPDLIVVRSNEVAASLVNKNPAVAKRLCVYVTGVVDADKMPDPLTIQLLDFLNISGATFLLQTPEMLAHFSQFIDADERRLWELGPMIKAPDIAERQSLATSNGCTQFVYAGKFAYDWNPCQIISGFMEVQREYPEIHLNILGDQFKADPRHDKFVPEIRALLSQQNAGFTWSGGVTRSEARRHVAESDVSISWRGEALSSSLELSTKVLEAGILGKPSILNPTPMHLRIFGRDYPFYADSMGTYVETLLRCVRNPVAIGAAARVVERVSLSFTHDRVLARLAPVIADTIEKAGRWPVGEHRMDLSSLSAADGLIRASFDWTVPLSPRGLTSTETGGDTHEHARIRQLESINAKLSRKITALNSKVSKLEKTNGLYQNLLNSKLGKLQSKYWNLRARSREVGKS